MDVEYWLTTLGLGEYAEAFNENAIDADILASLTAEDLRDLGIVKIGHRRRLMDAIADINGNKPAALGPSDKSQPVPEAAPVKASTSAERRHLTVMFVDLVGSTEMASRMDPEEMRSVITAYQNTIAGVVTRYEGFVAKYMGDGVLCYFGWPNAHEDDAERAVRAGLNAIVGVSGFTEPSGASLSVRIGIATGIVVVGDIVGDGAAQEAAVVGETPNLAARLQNIAEPDQIVISQATAKLLGTVFDIQDLGDHVIKGFAAPVRSFGIVGESASQSRFESRRRGSLSPIVGRESEIALMLQNWTAACSGNGRMILISGEAGIGKSRITRAVMGEVAKYEHRRITYQCSPYHTESAFYPIIQNIAYAAGFKPADDNDSRLDKLEAVVGNDPRTIMLVSPLLGLDATERYGSLDMTPAQQRAHTMSALVTLIGEQANELPLLIVFEDLHWVDPTTLELIELTLDAIADKPILILSTARPVFRNSFGGHPVVSHFALNRLGADQIKAIAARLAGDRDLPKEVLDIIVERTDGVPLFVEELTKTILETSVLKIESGRLVLRGPLEGIAIPHTLHDSLMARLDRLQPVKEVAQTAACIGREFGHTLLAAITALPVEEFDAALESLIEAELIYRRGVAPDASYLFKHALVRDAAYESLLRDRRQAIHARILEELLKSRDVAPEVRAYHAEAAGLIEQAIDLWEAASKAAIAQPAYDEAIAHMRHAIGLIEERIDQKVDGAIERALTLQVELGVALLAREGYGARSTKAAFERALALADQVGSTPLRYPSIYGLWVGMYVRGEHAAAEERAKALVTLANEGQETVAKVVSHRLLGTSLSLQGKIQEAQRQLEQASAYFDPVAHANLANRFGQDVGTTVNNYLAFNLLLAGQTRRSSDHARASVRIAEASGHLNTVCYAHMHCMIFALISGNWRALRESLDVMSPIVAEHRLTLWIDYAELMRGLMLTDEGRLDGLPYYLAADANFLGSESKVFLPLARIGAARQAAKQQQVEKASELAEAALKMVLETGEEAFLADCYRLKGQLALSAGDVRDAETNFLEAVSVSERQGTALYGLRASVDLARIWHGEKRTQEAASMITLALRRVAVGDCAIDRKEAEELIAQM